MTDEARDRSTGAGVAGEEAGGEERGAERETGTRSARGAVEIDAPPERVWRALTEAAELERWFPLEARVEPGVGGSIFMSWKNEFAGESEILAWEPPKLLRTSWSWSEDGPSQVTEYRIEGEGGRTFLRVVTSGFPTDAAWDAWVEGTERGWRFELASLKHYLERQQGRDRDVIYLRRRVAMSAEEAWDRLFGPEGFGELRRGGRAFDESAPVQYAAAVDDPPDALLRISAEPSYSGPESRDVTLWLSAWGGHGERVARIEEEWRRHLERLFPEGKTP